MVLALISYLFIRELFFWYNTQKLLDKLMSRNYYDYQVTKQYDPKVKDASQPNYVDEETENFDALKGVGTFV